MQKDKIIYLLKQYLEGQLTESQFQDLLQATGVENEENWLDLFGEMIEEEATMPQNMDAAALRAAFDKVVAVDKTNVPGEPTVIGVPVHRTPVLMRNWKRVAAIAASLVLVIGAATYFWFFRKAQHEMIQTASRQRVKSDVSPGGNKAILTLSNGSQIVLDSAGNGVLAKQGNTSISKSINGNLTYQAVGASMTVVDSTNTTDRTQLTNTLTTPRGGQYKLTLSDGSQVWLNAAASIRYPTVFTGKERKVELTGEAYFEVAKNAAMPFKVVVPGKEEVEVLGTHFNINAYPDEAVIRTTLLEGSVRVIQDQTSAILSPGQQARVSNAFSETGASRRAGGGKDAGQIDVIKEADLAEVMAWKNGLFRLTSADVPSIMRQLARWYDVEIKYEGGIPSGHITGEVPRNTSLLKVLEVMETSGVSFRIEGKKIIVKS